MGKKDKKLILGSIIAGSVGATIGCLIFGPIGLAVGGVFIFAGMLFEFF